MNREDIIRMAHDAGFEHIAEADYWHPLFEHFAALVASAAQAKERETCALLCYEQRKRWDALACADAIRAGTRPRGQA